MTNALRNHFKRFVRARRFGLWFTRRRAFLVPRSVALLGRRVALSYPEEFGVREDFIECILNDVYGLECVPGSPKAILDIGANVGFFSLAARQYFPAAKIHAYEPNPRILPSLTKNADVAGFTVFPEAVSIARGFMRIIDGVDSNQARVVSASSGEAGAIRCIAFETAIERLGGRVDLLKMDCEGGEWPLFKMKDDWTNVGALRMEYHLWSERRIEEVYAAVENMNFDVVTHQPSGEWGIMWCVNRRRGGAKS